ncbi:MAG: M20/M25/M40 family metallo-hydrolase [Candidatus Micrarchaeia archaeon]
MNLKFLAELVELNTNSERKSNYGECAELIKKEAERIGLGVDVYRSNRKPNLIISLQAPEKPTLLLATHYDVVPAGEGWKYPPFKLTIKNGKLYGRGAADDKGGILSALSALETLKKRNSSKVNVKLLVTCDEEVGGEDGIGFLMKLKKRGEFIVNGDVAILIDAGPRVYIGSSGRVAGRIAMRGKSTEIVSLLSDVINYSKVRGRVVSSLISASTKRRIWGRISVTMLNLSCGAVEYAKAGVKSNIIPGELRVKLRGRKQLVIKGRQGHAGYPHLAVNPIEKALPLLKRNMGGEGRCEIVFDLRTIPEETLQSAVADLRKYLADKSKAKFDLIEKSEGYSLPETHPFVEMMKKATGERKAYGTLGGTDAHFFVKRGIPSICFGPIADDSNVHGKDEFVRVKDLEFVSNSIVKLCESWNYNFSS